MFNVQNLLKACYQCGIVCFTAGVIETFITPGMAIVSVGLAAFGILLIVISCFSNRRKC